MKQKRDEHHQIVSRKFWSVLAVMVIVIVGGLVLFSVSKEKALTGEAYSVVQSQCPNKVSVQPVLSLTGDKDLPAGSSFGYDTTTADTTTAEKYVTGVKGRAFAFLFDHTYRIKLDDHSSSLTAFAGPFTIEGWVKLDEINKKYFLVDHGSFSERRGYFIYVDSDNYLYFLSFNRISPQETYEIKVKSPTGLQKGAWYHFAAVNRGSAGIQVYLNGVLGEASGNIELSTWYSGDSLIGATDDPQGASAFQGALDELNFYGQALSEEEISFLAHACKPQPGCDRQGRGLAMRLSGEFNTIDVKGNGHAVRIDKLNEDLDQQSNRYGEGIMGKAFKFGGWNHYDYLEIRDTHNQLDPQPDGFSLEVWYKDDSDDNFLDDDGDWMDQNNEILNRAMLAYKRKEWDWSPFLYGIEFIKYHPNNPARTVCQLSFKLKTDANVDEYAYTEAATAPSADLCSSLNGADQGWHQAVGVYSGERIYLYVDGVLRASTDTQGMVAADVNNAPFIIGASTPLKTVRNDDVTYSGEYFGGLIDEVSFYNEVLSSSEVKKMYQAGTRGKCIIEDCTTSGNDDDDDNENDCDDPDCLDLGTVKLSESTDYQVTLPCSNSAVNLRT